MNTKFYARTPWGRTKLRATRIEAAMKEANAMLKANGGYCEWIILDRVETSTVFDSRP